MPPDPLHWLTPWEPSWLFSAAMSLAAWLYYRGVRMVKPSALRQAEFWTGLAAAYAVLHTQLDYYFEHEFFMHRIQHSVLHHAAPFLIALSRPGVVLAAAWRTLPVTRHLRAQEDGARWLAEELNQPVTAAILFCGLILLWLLPPVHFLAMLDWRLYRVMNWGMLINGLMFWSLALNGRLSASRRVALMLAVIPPQIAMGMLIFAAPHPLYPLYSLCGRAFALSPLADQQLGGLILWVPAAMTSVAGVLVVMGREWMRETATPSASPAAAPLRAH